MHAPHNHILTIKTPSSISYSETRSQGSSSPQAHQVHQISNSYRLIPHGHNCVCSRHWVFDAPRHAICTMINYPYWRIPSTSRYSILPRANNSHDQHGRNSSMRMPLRWDFEELHDWFGLAISRPPIAANNYNLHSLRARHRRGRPNRAAEPH